jgi:hypothetical protein
MVFFRLRCETLNIMILKRLRASTAAWRNGQKDGLILREPVCLRD